MMPILQPVLSVTGVMMPGQLGPMARLRALHGVLDERHVGDRDALGDGDDEVELGVDALVDRVGRERGRHVDHRHGGAGGLLRLTHGVEHRHAFDDLTALAGRHAGDELGAVGERVLAVEEAGFTGEALAEDLGIAVDENAHGCAPAGCCGDQGLRRSP